MVIGSMGYFTYTYKIGKPTDPITFDPSTSNGTSKHGGNFGDGLAGWSKFLNNYGKRLEVP